MPKLSGRIAVNGYRDRAGVYECRGKVELVAVVQAEGQTRAKGYGVRRAGNIGSRNDEGALVSGR